jgi:DNA invertase Pin-like site-specific DNA recombinase
MAQGKFVSYLRVSTDRQGKSGLGLEAQRHAVNDWLNGGRWKLVSEHVEIESGRRSDRPELTKALAACRLHGATLVVAKLDRLARNAHFLLGLRDAGVEFVAVDMPAANRLTVGIMAMVAEEEARMISARTTAALAVARARGIKLGNPNNATAAGRRKGAEIAARARTVKARARAADMASTIAELRAGGIVSANAIAAALNDRAIPTPRSGAQWQAVQVQRVLALLA